MLQMKGWNYESTILINSTDSFERTNEFISTVLKVKSWQVKDPLKEVRVVVKKDWETWTAILPCQISEVQQNETWTQFKVSFLADIPANGTVRIGVLYGNDTAQKQEMPVSFSSKKEEDSLTITNDSYIISLDESTSQLSGIQSKYTRSGFLLPFTLQEKSAVQSGPRVLFASTHEGKTCPAEVSVNDTKVEIVEEQQGDLFYSRKWKTTLSEKASKQSAQVEGEVICCAGQPLLYFKEKITFPNETKVLGIELSRQEYTGGVFSHFTFRPTTDVFKETELEEMGHILIEPEFSNCVPDGLVFPFLDADIPWSSFVNINRNKWYGLNRFLMNLSIDPATTYRPGFYLSKKENQFSSYIAPVYVENKEHEENSVTIPAGTTYETSYVLHFSQFEEGIWGEKEDREGKRLNSPLDISVHPKYFDNGTWEEHDIFTFTGNRKNDYTKAGVR